MHVLCFLVRLLGFIALSNSTIEFCAGLRTWETGGWLILVYGKVVMILD